MIRATVRAKISQYTTEKLEDDKRVLSYFEPDDPDYWTMIQEIESSLDLKPFSVEFLMLPGPTVAELEVEAQRLAPIVI